MNTVVTTNNELDPGHFDTPHAQELIATAEAILAREYTTIRDENEAALVSEYRARAHQSQKDLDEERLDMGSGLRTTLEKINARFNVPIGKLRERVQACDRLLLSFIRQQRELQAAADRAREEEARQAREAHEAAVRAAEAASAPPPPPPPVVIEAPRPAPVRAVAGSFGSSTGTRKTWKWRLVSWAKVPKQFRKPPEECLQDGALTALARSQKDKASVPGIEFYEDEGMTSKVS